MSIRDAAAPRLVTLIGGPHEGDTPSVDVFVTAVTNESTGAVYTRREDGQYAFSGYETNGKAFKR